MCQHSLRASSKREPDDCLPAYAVLQEQDRDRDGLKSVPGTRPFLASPRRLREPDGEQDGFNSVPGTRSFLAGPQLLREQDGFKSARGNQTISFQAATSLGSQQISIGPNNENDRIEIHLGGALKTLATGSDNLLGPTRASELPPPLWGRVGVGGSGQPCAVRCPPHPSPPPRWGEGVHFSRSGRLGASSTVTLLLSAERCSPIVSNPIVRRSSEDRLTLEGPLWLCLSLV